MNYEGWYQVAFERDVGLGLTSIEIGDRPLMLVRNGDGIKAYDAVCPHRGANLSVGGILQDCLVACPFHGHKVGLGTASKRGFKVDSLSTIAVGGLVFVRPTKAHENGLAKLLEDLAQSHDIYPGFAINIEVEPNLVIENAFDPTHFRPVHGILNEPTFEIVASENGEFGVQGKFELPISSWQTGSLEQTTVEVPFQATAFSPWVVVSQLQGDHPYWVVTAATPTANGSSIVRLSIALPKDRSDKTSNSEGSGYLLEASRTGLEKDRLVWENLKTRAPHRFLPEDETVVEFQRFCEAYRASSETL